MPEALGSSYELDEVIGRGGMGEVWRGHARDGRELAFKLLVPAFAEEPSVVARFLRERAILVRLASPHVVRVHDLVAEGGRLAIVMELITGSDLRRELSRRGTLPPAEAVGLVAEILDGVAAAHALNVVHRDLKPGNVLLDHVDGQRLAKVSDFGIAQLAQESRLTTTSGVIGTPEYMAPEQAEAGEIGPATDLYSAGIVLYELLCGVTPFAVSGHPMAVLRGHVDREPGRPEGLPDDLWELVASLLAKDPSKRAPSARIAADTLNRLRPTLEGRPALPRLAGPPTSRSYITPAPTTMAKPGPFGTPPPEGDATTLFAEGGAPTTPPPPYTGGGRPGGPGGSRRPLVIGLVAAGVILVAALVGALLAHGSGNKANNTAANTPAPVTTSVEAAPTDATQTLPDASATTDSGGGGFNVPTTVVRHSGDPVALAPGNYIDLDAPTDRKNWDENVSSGDVGPDIELSSDGTTLVQYGYSSNANIAIVPPTAAPTYDMCSAASPLISSVSTDVINRKGAFCIQTDQTRYSYVQIVAAQRDPSAGSWTSVTLQITTWEFQNSPSPG